MGMPPVTPQLFRAEVLSSLKSKKLCVSAGGELEWIAPEAPEGQRVSML